MNAVVSRRRKAFVGYPFRTENWKGHGATMTAILTQPPLLCFWESPRYQNSNPVPAAALILKKTPPPQHDHFFWDIWKSLLWSRLSDATRGTRSHNGANLQWGASPVHNISCLFPSCHHILTDLCSRLSVTWLCAYHVTMTPRSLGCVQQLQPKAKLSFTSLRWQRAELALLTELVAPHEGDRH